MTLSEMELMESATEHVLVVVVPNGEHFVAASFDPDVASQGATVQEALRNLAEALDLAGEE